MNSLFVGLMNEATQLTRSGRLLDATHAIQRALRGGSDAQPASPVSSTRPTPEAGVIDVEARVIEAGRPMPSPDAFGEPEQWVKGTFSHQGRTIDYMLFVPASAANQPLTPRPLVVMLHGCTQGAADFAAGTRMNDHARESGVIVLYPEQAQRVHGQKCWNWFKTQHQQRDRGEPALLAALTQHVAAQQHADRARVYVAGLSAGGAMADVLGHCYPDIFAAIGVHSGLPHGAAHDMLSALHAMRTGVPEAPSGAAATPQPIIVFHGDADTTVHVNNGMAILAGATPGEVSEGQSPAGRRFTRTLYPASEGRGEAEHWRLHAAGHAWSGGSAQGSYTQPDGIDASREMLRFFLAHRLDETPRH
ncbi:poly(hydroxyalkanoate) depolymerase family esterase [Variovorax boronicumulans]|uniref:extracellular catalytic domain type 1 short-chain-length polyhydroxyalkanoate depolymerase n=1 Tax=Variovorax boronicumulans TaxID=436515 RepID=UPI00159DA03A|nr:PHB depolymerase family esterase [Variovorax boronicumulans]MDQ0017412.1 poly(hydroxyalkanoate) depolymerase family esterase [Variovorax boronicumulans]